MIPISLVTFANLSILEQLQLEEALLRADDRNWCIINHGTPPAIVMGISGKPELLIDPVQLQKNPVPVIRRFSGGGTVFVDHDTFFVTWIWNAETINVTCCPQKIHEWSASFYQKAFPHIEIQLKENDYAIGDRKFGGNAQYLCKGRWLHHSSLLWNYQSENMRYLLMPTRVPEYRFGRTHEDFLCRLNEHLPNKDAFHAPVVDALQQEFNVQQVTIEEVLKIKDRPHRKSTSVVL